MKQIYIVPFVSLLYVFLSLHSLHAMRDNITEIRDLLKKYETSAIATFETTFEADMYRFFTLLFKYDLEISRDLDLLLMKMADCAHTNLKEKAENFLQMIKKNYCDIHLKLWNQELHFQTLIVDETIKSMIEQPKIKKRCEDLWNKWLNNSQEPKNVAFVLCNNKHYNKKNARDQFYNVYSDYYVRNVLCRRDYKVEDDDAIVFANLLFDIQMISRIKYAKSLIYNKDSNVEIIKKWSAENEINDLYSVLCVLYCLEDCLRQDTYVSYFSLYVILQYLSSYLNYDECCSYMSVNSWAINDIAILADFYKTLPKNDDSYKVDCSMVRKFLEWNPNENEKKVLLDNSFYKKAYADDLHTIMQHFGAESEIVKKIKNFCKSYNINWLYKSSVTIRNSDIILKNIPETPSDSNQKMSSSDSSQEQQKTDSNQQVQQEQKIEKISEKQKEKNTQKIDNEKSYFSSVFIGKAAALLVVFYFFITRGYMHTIFATIVSVFNVRLQGNNMQSCETTLFTKKL